jgi:hypothetical protein
MQIDFQFAMAQQLTVAVSILVPINSPDDSNENKPKVCQKCFGKNECQ